MEGVENEKTKAWARYNCHYVQNRVTLPELARACFPETWSGNP